MESQRLRFSSSPRSLNASMYPLMAHSLSRSRGDLPTLGSSARMPVLTGNATASLETPPIPAPGMTAFPFLVYSHRS